MSFAGFSIPTKIVKAGRQAKPVGGLLGAHSVSKAVSKIRKVRRKSEFHSFLPGRSSRKRSQIANPNETGKQRKSTPCGLIPELPRSCRVSSCFALSCLVLFCPVQSCSVLSSLVQSCLVVSAVRRPTHADLSSPNGCHVGRPRRPAARCRARAGSSREQTLRKK